MTHPLPCVKSLYRFVLIGLMSIAFTGCLITHESETTHKGTSVAPATFAQIQPGKTTIGWVQATLGEPSSRTNTDGDIVWKYIYTEHTDSSGAIFLIFGGSTSNEKSETTFIEFKDGIVTNKWRG